MESYKVYLVSMKNNNILWETTVENIEILTGMLAISIGILNDINDNNTNDDSYYFDSDTDVSDFRILKNIDEEDVPRLAREKIKEHWYGIWINGSKKYAYDLYQFRSNNFFSGLKLLAESFNVDFRNYVYGFPFDSNGKKYALADYNLIQYQIAEDAPDVDDIEEEEEYDENIINPLARTDDIITLFDDISLL